jgi:hypothetical protein
MAKGIHTELTFEAAIEESLLDFGGYSKGLSTDFDAQLGLFPSYITDFLKTSQQVAWDKLVNIHKDEVEKKVIQRLVKEKETGIVRIYLKIYTNEAESYSALEPGNLFEIVDPGGQNQKPLNVKGVFDSIPPQSSVTGEIIFKILPDKKSVIIQIESKDGANYYEFNFENGSYKKAVLG